MVGFDLYYWVQPYFNLEPMTAAFYDRIPVYQLFSRVGMAEAL
jgi:hypothetical protein